MKIDQILFPFCLYDTHRFQKCRTLAEAAQDWDEEDESKIYLEYHLNTHFLFRMHRDPGFHQFVLKSMANDEQIVQKTSHYLKKLFYDWTCDLPSYYLPTPDITDESGESPDHIVDEIVAQYERNPVPFESTACSWANNKYFEYLSHLTSREHDDLSTSVLQDLISSPFVHNTWGMIPFHSRVENANKTLHLKSQKISKYFSHGILEHSQSQLEKEIGKNNLSLLGVIESSKLYEKSLVINHSESSSGYIHQNSNDSDLSPLFCTAPLLKNIRIFFADEFNIDTPEEILVDNEDEKFQSCTIQAKRDYVCFLKFTTDAIRIASEIWFSAMDTNKKLALLNEEYPFQVDIEALEEYPLERVDRSANEICKLEDYEDARTIFLHCLERAVTDIDRFYFNIALGYCSKELKDYTSARNHYTTGNRIIAQYLDESCWHDNLSCNLRRHKYTAKYWHLLSKAVVAEMNYHLGKKGTFKKEIDRVIHRSETLSATEKAQLLLEISYILENTNHRLRELRVLENLLHISHWNEDIHNYAKKRQFMIKKSMTPKNEQTIHEIQEIDNLNNATKLMIYFYNSFESYQFTRMLMSSRRMYDLHNKAFNDMSSVSYTVATSLFYLQRYNEATPYYQEYLNNCSPSDYDPLGYSGFPGVCRICDGEEDEGIILLKQEIAHIFSILPIDEAKKSVEILLKNVARLTRIRGDDVTEQILESLSTTLYEYMPHGSALFYISSAYVEIGWFSKAIRMLNCVLENSEPDENNRAFITGLKGWLYNENGEFDAALTCYLKAEKSSFYSVPGKQRANLMKKMAEVYNRKMNLSEAKKCLETAMKCDPEDNEVKTNLGNIDRFLTNHLSDRSVKNREARYCLNTAEKEALDFYRDIEDDEEFDFSPPLMNYAKGLEVLLENEVWNDIRGKVLDEFSRDYSNGIPKKYYNGLPFCWKGPLNRYEDRRKTVSLGTWKDIDIEQKSDNPVLQAIRRHLKELYGEKFIVIKNACTFLAPFRNEIAHGGIKGKSELHEVRGTVITHLNNVISLLYNPEGTEEFSTTFAEENRDVMLVEKAIEHANSGEFEKALDYYCQAVEADPKNIDAHIGKGQIYTTLGEYDKAEISLDIASQIDAEDTHALHAKGCLYSEKGDYGLAAQQFQAVIRIDPSHNMAMLNLGCVFRNMAENAMALQCFENVRKINPDTANLEMEYKSCIQAIKDAENELQNIDGKIRSDPDNGILHNSKGFLLFTLGRYEEALAWFDSALELSYSEPNVWFYRGQTLLRLNRPDEANQSFAKSGMV